MQQLRFQAGIKKRSKSTELLRERKEKWRRRRHYATLASNTALVVTCTTVSQDFPPRGQRALIRNIKNCWGSHIFTTVHCRKKRKKKSLGHNNVHKKNGDGGVFYAVTCGMIRDHPGMLRLVRLHCAAYRFLYSGRAERDPERGWTLLWRQEKNA